MEANLTQKLKHYDEQSSALIKQIQAKLEGKTSNTLSQLSIPETDPKDIKRIKEEIQAMQKTTYDLIEEEIDTVDGIYNEMGKCKAEIKCGLGSLARKVGRTDQNFAHALKTYFINNTASKKATSEIDIQSVITKGDYLNRLHAHNLNKTHGTSIFGTGQSKTSMPFNVFQPKQLENIFKRYKQNKLNDSEIENYSSNQQNIFNNTNEPILLKKAHHKLNRRSQSGHIPQQKNETPAFRKPNFGSKFKEMNDMEEKRTNVDESISLMNKIAAQTQNMANKYVLLGANPSFSDKKQFVQTIRESKTTEYHQSGKKEQSLNRSNKMNEIQSAKKPSLQNLYNNSSNKNPHVTESAAKSNKNGKNNKSLKYCLNNESEDDEVENHSQDKRIQKSQNPYNKNIISNEKEKNVKQMEPRDSISEALDFSYKKREAAKNMNSVEFGSFDDEDFDDL